MTRFRDPTGADGMWVHIQPRTKMEKTMFKTKWIPVLALGALLAAGSAQAQKKVVAVWIPAANPRWPAGGGCHARAPAKEINKAFPGVEVIVKTSPSAAAQVSALEDLSAGRNLAA